MVPLKVKKAVIDIGTNTFNLLIARADISGIAIVETHKEAVSLGMGGINDNRSLIWLFKEQCMPLRHLKQF